MSREVINSKYTPYPSADMWEKMNDNERIEFYELRIRNWCTNEDDILDLHELYKKTDRNPDDELKHLIDVWMYSNA